MPDPVVGPRDPDVETFEAHRGDLVALAYRMLGDLHRAEDVVQDAWLRWSGRRVAVADAGAYLATTTTRLCLNEIDSAKSRRESHRLDVLPEPVDLALSPFDRIAHLEDLSMAVLVALQKLTPAERAALLLYDVFDFSHAEIAKLVGKSEAASRQLVHRARNHIRDDRRALEASDAEHRRLLLAFSEAARDGEVDRLAQILAEDVVLIVDAGPEGGTFGGARNLPGPLRGRKKVCAFVAAVTPRGAAGLATVERRVNGRPALVTLRGETPFAILSVSVGGGLIDRVFIHNDPERLGRIRN